MKAILVPTDFSANADNALTFACEMNKKLNAMIELLHSYNVPAVVGEVPVMPVSEVEMRKAATDGLNRTKNIFEKKYPGVQFNINANIGTADHVIVSNAEKLNCELIIMGTQGASGLGEFLVGTNTGEVIEKSSCPVIAVPEKATFNGLKKIVYAAGYGAHNFSHVHKIIEFARLFDSEIILLHISNGTGDDAFEDLEIKRFKAQIADESNYTNISYRMHEDKDVFHGLNSYIEQFTPDLLVTSMKNRSLIQKIFSRSLTKRMAYHSHVPVLALHIA